MRSRLESGDPDDGKDGKHVNVAMGMEKRGSSRLWGKNYLPNVVIGCKVKGVIDMGRNMTDLKIKKEVLLLSELSGSTVPKGSPGSAPPSQGLQGVMK